MKIAVFGAGAVGGFYGALLARAGHDVHFITRGAQLEALRATGLRLDSRRLGEVIVAPVSATDRPVEIGVSALVLVCVKAHQTRGILDDLLPLVGEDTIVLPLQNGVESDDVLAERFGRRRVPAAVVYVGATLVEPGVVRHVTGGSIVIGARPGFDASRLDVLREALARAFRVEISDDIQRERWLKLVWNATVNPVSAIAQRSPHELVMNPHTRELLRSVMREVMAVARAQGIRLPDSVPDDYFAWMETAPEVRSSMQVHRARGTSMETDSLVGVVMRRGKEYGVATPLSEALYALLTAIESTASTPVCEIR
jgi:2-dehydropantoate 2-reductase